MEEYLSRYLERERLQELSTGNQALLEFASFLLRKGDLGGEGLFESPLAV